MAKNLPKRTPKHVKRAVSAGVVGYNHNSDIESTLLGSSAFSKYDEVYRVEVEGYSKPKLYVSEGIVRIENSQGESALELGVEGDEDTTREAAEMLGLYAKPKESKRRIGIDVYMEVDEKEIKLDRIDKDYFGIPKDYGHA